MLRASPVRTCRPGGSPGVGGAPAWEPRSPVTIPYRPAAMRRPPPSHWAEPPKEWARRCPSARPTMGIPISNTPNTAPTWIRVRASTPETPMATAAAKLESPTETAARTRATMGPPVSQSPADGYDQADPSGTGPRRGVPTARLSLWPTSPRTDDGARVTESTIIYTHTDEAPALATYSFLPVVQAYASTAGVRVETRDISLAGRIIAGFPEFLDESQRIGDALAELGALANKPEANIIKLPNVSASSPQLKAAIVELQQHGYALPDYPDDPKTDEERQLRTRYDKVMGSAVNPVLRQGNADRRAPASVKNYAKAHPHRMGAWLPDSRTNVAHMEAGDFRSTERSAVITEPGSLRIELVSDDGSTTVLRESVPVLAGEVVDSSVMRVGALRDFVAAQIARAKAEGVLFSVHLKATMMKISDPIIFGHVVRAFFPKTFARHGEALATAGLSPNDGLGAIL